MIHRTAEARQNLKVCIYQSCEQKRLLTFFGLCSADTHIKYSLRQQSRHAAAYVYYKLLQCEIHQALGDDM